MGLPEFPRPQRPVFPQERDELTIPEPTAVTVIEPQKPEQTVVEAENLEDFVDEFTQEIFIGSSKKTQTYIQFIENCFHTDNVPYLEGLPGVGKTAIINAIAQRTKQLMRTIIGSQIEPSDMLGLPVLKTLSSGSIITEFTKPDWFQEVEEYSLANAQGAIVFLDEITTSPPPVQAAMLRFIAERRIGKYILPENVYIIAAGNPPSVAADGNQLAPPTANRLAHVYYEPSVPDWLDGMTVAFNRSNVSDNEYTQRSFVVSFLTENTSYINNMPEDPEEAAKAWPSMRSWDNATRALGRTNDITMAKFTLDAFVGEEASHEYLAWLEQLKLPDLNSILAAPEAFDWRSLNASSLYLTLYNLTNLLSAEIAPQVIKVFTAAQKARKNDIIYSLHTHLNKKLREEFKDNSEESRQIRLEAARMFNDILQVLSA